MRDPETRGRAAAADPVLHLHQGTLLLAVAGLLFITGPARSVEIHELFVDQRDSQYFLLADSSIAAPPEFIHGVLMDFDNFHRLTGGIAESHFLEPEASDPEQARLGYTRIDSCVWFYCRSFERVERIHAEPPSLFRTEVIAERSDFKSYKTEWQLRDEKGGTRIRFSAAMQPDFWIPAVIGKWAVRRKLELTAQQMGQAIEYLYRNGLTLADIPPESGPD